MSIADGKVDILVDVDTKNAKKELEEFIKEYSNKKHKIEISVDANPQIHKQFKKIVQEFANSTININLGLDVSKAREQLNDFIKNCKSENIQFGVNFDQSSAKNDVKEISDFANRNLKNQKPLKLGLTLDEYAIRGEAKRYKAENDRIIRQWFKPNIYDDKISDILRDFYKHSYDAEWKKKQIDDIAKQRKKEQLDIEKKIAKEQLEAAKIAEKHKNAYTLVENIESSYKKVIDLNKKILSTDQLKIGPTLDEFKLRQFVSELNQGINKFFRNQNSFSEIGVFTDEILQRYKDNFISAKYEINEIDKQVSDNIKQRKKEKLDIEKKIAKEQLEAAKISEKYRKAYTLVDNIESSYKKVIDLNKKILSSTDQLKIGPTLDEFKLKQFANELNQGINKFFRNQNSFSEIGVFADEILQRYKDNFISAKYEINEIDKQVSDNIKQRAKEQMALESQKTKTTIDSARVQNDAYSRILNSLSNVNKRIFNLLRNAFVFNVISRGFRSLSEWSRILINRDLQLSNSLEIVKANLVNAFMPIWQAILPWIRALGEGLAWLSQQLVNFINLFAGGNAKVIRSVEEAKPALREFKELIGGADKALIPNIPKFKLNKPEKIKTPKIASQKPWIPSTLKSLETQKPKRKNILDNLRNNIEKISNKLPKINKNLYKSKRELASFDKLEVLKFKKSSLDAIKDAFKEFGENKSKSNLSKYLPNIADNISQQYNYNDFVKDIKDAFKGHKYSDGNFTFGDYSSPNSINTKAIKNLFGKSGKIDKMQLPKIDFEVNPQSTLNLESFKKWFSGNTGPATLFKSALIGLSGFGIAKLIAKLFGRSITLTPAGALVAVGLGSIANACIEATKRMEEGEKTAKKILEEHPGWVGIHVDKKGHPTFGVLPGEKPEDYSSIHDTQLAEILAIEERSKQIKLGKEKEYLKERSELNRENIEELDAIHEEERKKTKKSFAELLIKTESLLNIFKNNSKNAIKEYYGDMKRISENTTDSLINNKSKDTMSLRDELLKQKNIFSNFASDIEETNNNIANKLKDFKKEDTNTLIDELSKQKIVFKGFMYDIEINVGNIIGIIKNFVAGVISYFEDVGERMSNLFNPYHQQLRTESGVQIKPWYPKEFVEFLEENAKNKKLNIPHLAQGAVLRGGDPFLAYLGDQPRGQTNIEAPLSTIVDAFKIALSEVGSPINNININATGDMSQMIRFLNLKINEENRRIGRSMISLVGGE